jgi:hypothetical protein
MILHFTSIGSIIRVGIGGVPDTGGDDSSNVLQITGSVLATKYHGDGSSLTGIENSQWLHNMSDSTKIYYNGGNVGIGVTDPDSKLEVDGDIYATGDVTASSDRRLKTDIKRIEGALNKVRTLGGYTFTKNDNPSTGLIAQEVLEVLPEAVHGTEETYYSIAYGNMVGILIEAIKELSDEVKELKEKIG